MPEKDLSHEARLRELRERLYSRGAPPPAHERRELSDETVRVAHGWQMDAAPELPVPVVLPDAQRHEFAMPLKRTARTYRTKLIVSGLVFFVVALVLSGSFLLFGKNQISGDNISIETKAPFAIGGGEELPLQVTITNKNSVPIESATLIVEYPFGTQSADEIGKELFRERKQLARLNPGEVVEIPIRARVFGEENEEKTVVTSIEYRVAGSNATFTKVAEPVRFKISSSPVVLSVENVTKSASGQEAQFKITVSSNAPNELNEVLVKAEYPLGFDFTSAEPSPVSGRDTWSISKLKPEEKRTIVMKGLLVGKQSESKIFKFSVGVPNERDRFSLASVFMTQTEEINIEKPFLGVAIVVNSDKGERPTVTPGSTVQVSIGLTNTLSETLNDVKIVAQLAGIALNESEVRVSGGLYDSSNNTITWDANSVESLRTVIPGRTSTVSFNISPLGADDAPRTPSIKLAVSVEGDRVTEDRAIQKLTGTATREIRVESAVALSSSALYSTGGFTNTGPIPPQAEQVTTYSMVWHVKNGTNAVTDGLVTVSLPAYVTWLDLSSAQPTYAYNPQTRTVTWKVGDLGPGEERESTFQISLKPSLSHVGQILTLLNTQYFKATDRFTGTTVRAESRALTTKLLADPLHEADDGRVGGGAGQ